MSALAIGWAFSAARADEPKTLDEIQAEVEGLRTPAVAWRQVRWRTCLIEGLRESRDTGKPLMLWVFIDRPIDDERC
ncbi:MAG: hypothetical protein AB7I30_10090 [Isosphaeraceae bacterium]